MESSTPNLSLIPIRSQTDPATLPALILSMVIGKEEAMQMAMTIEDLHPTMPYPADLFKTATDAFGYKLDSVTIDSLDEEGIYHSTMRYSNGEKSVELHARVADAVTMALKHRSPIYAVREILKNIE